MKDEATVLVEGLQDGQRQWGPGQASQRSGSQLEEVLASQQGRIKTVFFAIRSSQ